MLPLLEEVFFEDVLPVVEEPAPDLADVLLPALAVVDLDAEVPALDAEVPVFAEVLLLAEPEVPEVLLRPEVLEELPAALGDILAWFPVFPAPILACEPEVLPELCEPDEPLIPEEDDDEPKFVFVS